MREKCKEEVSSEQRVAEGRGHGWGEEEVGTVGEVAVFGKGNADGTVAPELYHTRRPC